MFVIIYNNDQGQRKVCQHVSLIEITDQLTLHGCVGEEDNMCKGHTVWENFTLMDIVPCVRCDRKVGVRVY